MPTLPELMQESLEGRLADQIEMALTTGENTEENNSEEDKQE